ncbi:MAG: hypothetical protein ACI3YI_13190 [Bacteroidaceae bacterium]
MNNVKYKDFDCSRFENEVFGVGFLNKSTREPKPGWLSWQDVRSYFGLGVYPCNERELRQGYMSEKLHDALERKLGGDRLASYFPAVQEKKEPKEDIDVYELATLMYGSVNDVNKIRDR